MNDYKIYKHNKPMKIRRGRPVIYLEQMLACENLNDSFFVERSMESMKITIWRYHKKFEKSGVAYRFSVFKDTKFRCKACGAEVLHSQLEAGPAKCLECGQTELKLVAKGCSIQRIK